VVRGVDALGVAEKNTIKGTGVEPNESILKADGWKVLTPTQPFATPIDAQEATRTDWLRPDLEISPGPERTAAGGAGFPGIIIQEC
jgi:hypothetical protein